MTIILIAAAPVLQRLLACYLLHTNSSPFSQPTFSLLSLFCVKQNSCKNFYINCFIFIIIYRNTIYVIYVIYGPET